MPDTHHVPRHRPTRRRIFERSQLDRHRQQVRTDREPRIGPILLVAHRQIRSRRHLATPGIRLVTRKHRPMESDHTPAKHQRQLTHKPATRARPARCTARSLASRPSLKSRTGTVANASVPAYWDTPAALSWDARLWGRSPTNRRLRGGAIGESTRSSDTATARFASRVTTRRKSRLRSVDGSRRERSAYP